MTDPVATMLIDIHMHTPYSDGLASLEAIESHCLRKRVGIGVTDHNEIRGAIKLVEHERIPVIPGIEVGTVEGLEFLVYFPNTSALEAFYVHSVEPYLLERFMVRSKVRSLPCLDDAIDLGGFAALAHPFAPGRKSVLNQEKKRGGGFVGDVIKRVHGVEIHNSGMHLQSNRRASDFAMENALAQTAGSDAHTLASIGTSGMLLPVSEKPTTQELYETLADATQYEITAGPRHSLIKLLSAIAFKHTKFAIVAGNRNQRHVPSDDARELVTARQERCVPEMA